MPTDDHHSHPNNQHKGIKFLALRPLTTVCCDAAVGCSSYSIARIIGEVLFHVVTR